MKKYLFPVIAIIVIVILVIIIACMASTPQSPSIAPKKEPEVVPPQSITIQGKEEIELNVGNTYMLTATIFPINATDKNITWSVSNSSIIKVNNGQVTALAEGTATVTATTVNGKTGSVKFIISDPDKRLNYNELLASKPLYWSSDINSVGGIAFAWEHKYIGTKTINYVTINYTLLDAIGNPITDEITHRPNGSVRIIGPYSDGLIYLWGLGSDPTIIAYCEAASEIRFDSLMFEFADGTSGQCDYGWIFKIDENMYGNDWGYPIEYGIRKD